MKKITQNDFIKVGNRYLLKNSNSLYFDEAEMKKMISNKSLLDEVIVKKCECEVTKKVVAEDEAKPIKTDIVKETITTKK